MAVAGGPPFDPKTAKGGLPQCKADLDQAQADLETCYADLAACEAQQANLAAVLQTGQTDCWDLSGALIECDGTAQDGDVQAGAMTPSPRFTDNLDGTVKDELTGLIWL
jgi:hypothetical protein